MSSEEAQKLIILISQMEGKIESLSALNNRKAVSPTLTWVSEKELTYYIPYSLKDIRMMRKLGKIKAYPDRLLGTKKVFYNLHEVSAKLEGTQNKKLRDFDPESVHIQL